MFPDQSFEFRRIFVINWPGTVVDAISLNCCNCQTEISMISQTIGKCYRRKQSLKKRFFHFLKKRRLLVLAANFFLSLNQNFFPFHNELQRPTCPSLVFFQSFLFRFFLNKAPFWIFRKRMFCEQIGFRRFFGIASKIVFFSFSF